MIVLHDTEYGAIVSSFVWTKHRNVTDGRTDRQICFGYIKAHALRAMRTRCEIETSSHVRVNATYAFFSQHPLSLSASSRVIITDADQID